MNTLSTRRLQTGWSQRTREGLGTGRGLSVSGQGRSANGTNGRVNATGLELTARSAASQLLLGMKWCGGRRLAMLAVKSSLSVGPCHNQNPPCSSRDRVGARWVAWTTQVAPAR